MRGLLVVLVGCLLVIYSEGSKSKFPFPYHLEEEHHALAGRVIYDAHRGARVAAILEKQQSEGEHGSHDTEEEVPFLRVVRKLVNHRKLINTTVRFDISGMTKLPEPARLTSQDARSSQTAGTIAPHTDVPGAHFHTIHKRATSHDVTANEITVNRVPSARAGTALRQTSRNHVTNDFSQSSQDFTNSDTASFSHTNTENDRLTSRLPLTGHVTSENHVTSPKRTEDKPLFQEEEDTSFRGDPDLVYVIENADSLDKTDYFEIDDDDYVVVVDSSTFGEYSAKEFYVYLTKRDGEIVANPLAFIVYIDKPEEKADEYPAAPAILAGVLVCIIVFLALFIPFVTRAKRRRKEGKPVFKMGSHPSMADLERIATLNRVETREPNWYGNNTVFSYEEEVEKEKLEFTSGIKRFSRKDKHDKEPPTLQLNKKKKTTDTESSASSSSEAAGSTQDDLKPIQPRKKKSFRERLTSHP